MSSLSPEIIARCQKLGIECDELPADQMSSGLAALACFPMYMVANVHAWTGDSQFKLPVLDLPGAEHIREAFELGKQQGGLGLDKQHRQLLSTLLDHPKPCDLVVYEYALDTINTALNEVAPNIATMLRGGIAQMIVAVAEASGKGLLGTGKKISDNERACIRHVTDQLQLEQAESARKALEGIV